MLVRLAPCRVHLGRLYLSFNPGRVLPEELGQIKWGQVSLCFPIEIAAPPNWNIEMEEKARQLYSCSGCTTFLIQKSLNSKMPYDNSSGYTLDCF